VDESLLWERDSLASYLSIETFFVLKKQIWINKTLDERCLMPQAHWFGGGRGATELFNPFNKGFMVNFTEAVISTFSYQGLSRKMATLDISIDEENGDRETWENLLDSRLRIAPLNWSKTFITLLFELDCPAQTEMVARIEAKKMKFKQRGDKDRKGRSDRGIDVSSESSESQDSDSDSDGGNHGSTKCGEDCNGCD
jgi:hypothetical protein